MTNFATRIKKEQIEWRRRTLHSQMRGYYNGRQYDHVLPRSEWNLNLWQGIRDNSQNSLQSYITACQIKPHVGIHNLCSSWVLCANLYFPFRSVSGRKLLAGFLSKLLNVDVISCDVIELEYEHQEKHLKPAALLGEEQGGRGTGQTSPDVAFKITTDKGPALILVESKYSEHWFYECSGHKKKTKGRDPNPDRKRCNSFTEVIIKPDALCHLNHWGRHYWNHLGHMVDIELAKQILVCPAATGAYQLFRQQSLAEALSKIGGIGMVVSTVAYDARNEKLFYVIRKLDGTVDLRNLWTALFNDKIRFKCFTHQSWVNWVRQANSDGLWNDWLKYVADRYGY